jgi:hypothetical protein
MNGEYGIIWKECIVACFKALYLNGLNKTNYVIFDSFF